MTRTIAYYLPQFHSIPENDGWWGEGFTEWVNVRRARPLFSSHAHPRVAGALGEYDLLDREIHRAQTDLAKEAGVDAFCMYFYWFGGTRLLERPIDAWREDPSLLPYCLSWANESWTRRWDGKSRSVLIAQDYDEGYEAKVFADLLPHFLAPHYLRHDGKPVLLVHRAQVIPDPRAFATRVRALAVEAGLPGLHLIASETSPELEPHALGFDAVSEFPPVGANTLASAQLRPLKRVVRGFRGRLMSYPRMARRFERRAEAPYTRHHGVAPAWDNTARRQLSATIYVGSSPERYAEWLSTARRREYSSRGEDGLVFINAWNEWAEGAYLEPDKSHGRDYLTATADPTGFVPTIRVREPDYALFWSFGQLRSIMLTAVGSALALVRRMRNRSRVR
ncbi:glycosyltransferase WbsX family protein [Microbacterium algeriense]|uniref:glycosyltransferase WbsX family protein n=1 Tax=Microbacterium algeriense TaxID=2615184 RepID=UPI0009FA49CE|nr:glycoside hydrolase family 99-like domain-containing protein [Microbacterium barkeri]